MAGYMPAQALLKTLLATCPSMATDRVVESDERILDAGLTPIIMLYPGAIPTFDTAGRVREHNYEAMVNLLVRIGGDDTPHTTLGALRDEVLAMFDSKPCPTNEYFITSVVGDDIYGLKRANDTTAFWLVQPLRVTISEQV